MILGVSGHREIHENTPGELVEFARLFVFLSGADRIITGMAVGWDLAVAEACRDLSVPFVAAVPFANQPERWSRDQRALWERLIPYAARVHVCQRDYDYAAYEKRNRWIVNNSGSLDALLQPGRERSGTGRCVLYARKRGRKVDILWDRWKRFQETRSKR